MKKRREIIGRERLGLFDRIKSYRLESNVYALILLSALAAVALYFFMQAGDESGFVPNLLMAVSTSLMASVLVIASETYVKFRQHKNDVFLEGIQKLGISNLHFDRAALLRELVDDCERAFWAVGYRHILTRSLRDSIEQASERGATIRILIVPPWTDSFRLVYGNHERVIDNYVMVLDSIARGNPGHANKAEVRFLNCPLFNDTYKVDDQIVTGPYLHNQGRDNGKITADNFFTYELGRASRLHELIYDEYEALWDGAEEVLDWACYTEVTKELATRDLNEAERTEYFRQACKPRTQVAQ